MYPVDAGVVLVTEHRNGDVMPFARRRCRRFGWLLRLGILHRPACIPVLLREFGGFVLPRFRDFASLDRILLVLAVVLPWSLDDRRVDDLPSFGKIADFGLTGHRFR